MVRRMTALNAELLSNDRQHELKELVETYANTSREARERFIETLPNFTCQEWLCVWECCKDKRAYQKHYREAGYGGHMYTHSTYSHHRAYQFQVHAWKQVMATARSLLDWVNIAECGTASDRKIAYKAIALFKITKQKDVCLLRRSGSVWVQNIGEYLSYREGQKT